MTMIASKSATGLDVERIRADFPILKREINGYPLVYLDSASSSQKPRQVIDALRNYYERNHANVHRGLYTLAVEATDLYEGTRQKVADFIHAESTKSIIFTRNATESVNLVAFSWGNANLKKDNEILISELEHHANIVPWVNLCERTGARLRVIPINSDGELDLSGLDELLNSRTKIVALTRMSNALGTLNDLTDIFNKAKALGAITLLDAAQSAPHMETNVRELGCDFLVFSAHKMLGPTGVGVLYGRPEILEKMPPFLTGGEMIDQVTFEKVTYNELPWKFEAGTPNIADVVAFGSAIDYLTDLGMDNIRDHEKELTEYIINRLREIPSISIIGPTDLKRRGGAISFTDKDIHPHDIGTFLDNEGIAIRAGHHCAQPLMKRLGIPGTARASFGLYNTHKEVDKLAAVLRNITTFFAQ